MDLECYSSPIKHSGIYVWCVPQGPRIFHALTTVSGVSGPWYASLKDPECMLISTRWYGVGGTIQLAFFAMVAAKVKMNANGAHTFLEVIVRCI